jgi:hypothetical protein
MLMRYKSQKRDRWSNVGTLQLVTIVNRLNSVVRSVKVDGILSDTANLS